MTDIMTRQRVEEAVAIARSKGQRPCFRGADLSCLHLPDMDLHDADLRDANLRYANLRNSNLRRVNLSDADLTGARMSYANATGGNLRGATLDYADLSGAYMYRTDLSEADLIGANLFQTDLYLADMRSVNLFSANLRDADLSYTVLTGSNLIGLFLDGLPSGHLIFIPTPEGWHLTIGCWSGTTAELREMIAKDDDWPGAEGWEIPVRRPMLEAAADMCDSYAAANSHALDNVKSAANQWKEN